MGYTSRVLADASVLGPRVALTEKHTSGVLGQQKLTVSQFPEVQNGGFGNMFSLGVLRNNLFQASFLSSGSSSACGSKIPIFMWCFCCVWCALLCP